MKRRCDSFFGIHMDFHATPEKCKIIGENLKEEDIRNICRTFEPDYIQIDCKGHPGWCSYPTKLGNGIEKFSQDPLKLWRKVTREEDIALYMHYSGVYDMRYCSENPDERVKNADGTYSEGFTRLDSDYVDKLLIPQLFELAKDYEVDGVWIDGDCWSAMPDFRDESLITFEKETGIDLKGKAPATKDDQYFYEYRDYARGLFRKYLNHYIDTVHEKYPDFQIASNWAFSDHMPEEISANVDFISGDLNPHNSFNSARYAARAIAQQDFPWDLMSWDFRAGVLTPIGTCDKHINQILQEAAGVISLGGGFQNYTMQFFDGSPNIDRMMETVKMRDFLRDREKFCHKGKQVKQTAILLSTYDRSRESINLYSRNGFEKIMGLTALFCDAGHSTGIVSEHKLKNNYNSYPMIVVPETYAGLEDKTICDLLSYAESGGNLVLVGKNTLEVFSKAGASFKTKLLPQFKTDILETENGHESTVENTDYRQYPFTMDNKNMGSLLCPTEIVADNMKILASLSKENSETVAGIIPYGKGKIALIGFDIGSQYLMGAQYLHRNLIKELIRLYTPKVKIEASTGLLEVVCLEKDERLMLQLVNANGNHNNPNVATDDVILPVLDISLSIAMDKMPKALIFQPENRKIPFKYCDGRVYFDIGRLDIHGIVEVVEE